VEQSNLILLVEDEVLIALGMHLPVVYVSGNSARDHSVKGVTDSIMLQKPFVSAKLVSAISTLIKASSVVPSA